MLHRRVLCRLYATSCRDSSSFIIYNTIIEESEEVQIEKKCGALAGLYLTPSIDPTAYD